jgi:hypothetical protein
MEIEFTVQIDPEKRRHECHAALAFVTAGSLALLLIGLCCPPLWLCLTGFWIPLILVSFDRYRKMRQQERLPDKIYIDSDSFIYWSGGKPCFSLPLSRISRADTRGGLKVFLKGAKKINVLNPKFQLAKFLAQAKRQRCDLFFPWFDELSRDRLKDIMQADQADHISSL